MKSSRIVWESPVENARRRFWERVFSAMKVKGKIPNSVAATCADEALVDWERRFNAPDSSSR